MTTVYSAYQPPAERSVRFGSQRTIPTSGNSYVTGQLYKQAQSTDSSNAYGARRTYAHFMTSPAPMTEQRQPLGQSTSYKATPRPALSSRPSQAASAPITRKGNDYFGLATSQTPRPAQSAPAREPPRLGGPKSFNTESLLNNFLSLPPLTVTLEALFYYDSTSSCWFLAKHLPLHLVKAVSYEPRQYVDGIVPPQCISAGFIQQKVHIKHNQFDQTERKDNQDKQSALHMYGAKQIDQWGKKIRVRAEIDYPRKMAWFGARPRQNGKKVFTVIGATTTWDMFPNIPNLPSNYNGNRQNSYVTK